MYTMHSGLLDLESVLQSDRKIVVSALACSFVSIFIQLLIMLYSAILAETCQTIRKVILSPSLFSSV